MKNMCACHCGQKKSGPNAHKRRFIPGHNQIARIGKEVPRGRTRTGLKIYKEKP